MSEVAICYGMTETSPVSTQTRVDDPLERRVATVGRVGPHVEVKVVDPDSGLVVERGVAGELCTRGYSVMLGYWEDPERTAEAVDRAGWMHTGDLATMDDEGYLNIVGRSKDMVIRGGENVYPREVEEFLYTHEAIADVQVVGVPDEKYGEELCAWVIARPGADARRGRRARVLPRAAGALQGPALRDLRRRVPDDGHGQGPEVQDARDVGGAAGPAGCGGGAQRLRDLRTRRARRSLHAVGSARPGRDRARARARRAVDPHRMRRGRGRAGAGRPAGAGRDAAADRRGERARADRRLPSGWRAAAESLTPHLTDPREELAVATFPLRYRETACAHMPGSALEDLGQSDAFVTLEERGLDPGSSWVGFPARPARFGPSLGGPSEASACTPTARFTDHWFTFSDAGRHFHVLVAFGPQAPEEVRRQAWTILDSLRVDPGVVPDWSSAG